MKIQKINYLISLFENLYKNFRELLELNKKKYELLVNEYKAEELVDFISKEDFIGRKISGIQSKITQFYQENKELLGFKEFSLSNFLNVLVDYDEIHVRVSKLKTDLNNILKEYKDIKELNDMLLKTQVDYYRYLFKSINKNTSYKNKNKKISLYNQTA